MFRAKAFHQGIIKTADERLSMETLVPRHFKVIIVRSLLTSYDHNSRFDRKIKS